MVWGALLALSAFLPSSWLCTVFVPAGMRPWAAQPFGMMFPCFCCSRWRSVGLIPSAAWARVSQRTSVRFPEEVRLYKYVCLRTQPDGTSSAGISDPANLCTRGWTFSPSSYLSSFFFCIAEFDKFLEERAKAAEMVPNLPSPPLEAPTPPTNPSSRKKQERSEDALFALWRLLLAALPPPCSAGECRCTATSSSHSTWLTTTPFPPIS